MRMLPRLSGCLGVAFFRPSGECRAWRQKRCNEELAAQLAPRLARARYMAASGKPVTVANWEGFPTMQYTYSVPDKALNTNKTASVILLDPDAPRLARWMVNACLAAKGSVTTDDLKKLAN